MHARRVGLVGAGRSRNGTGPFLARHLEAAGLPVVAVVGRDLPRARVAARELGGATGREVRAFDATRVMLEEARVDVVAIAAPTPVHLAVLEAACAAGADVLCEKPFVAPADLPRVPELLDAFRARSAAVVEACQWPFALAAFDALWPGWRRLWPLRRLALGLSPTVLDPQAMFADALPHLLSLVQAVVPVEPHTRVVAVAFEERSAEACSAEIVLAEPFPALTARLELRPVLEQPRPACIAIDGHRVERRIALPDYAIRFADGADPTRSAPVADPLGQLVYRAALIFTERDVDGIRDESDRIRARARLSEQILGEW